MDNTLINLIIAFLLGIAVAGLVAHIIYLTNRVKMLEEASRKNIPYRTYEEIQNAKAVLNNEYFQALCKIDMIKNCGSHMDRAIEYPKAVK